MLRIGGGDDAWEAGAGTFGVNEHELEWGGFDADQSRLVMEIAHAIRDGLPEDLEAHVADGISEVDHPRNTARRIERSGGGIELRGFDNAVARVRQELEAVDANYLCRPIRDKRWDRSVRCAMRDGREIPAAMRNGIVERYRERLFRRISETVTITRSNYLHGLRSFEAMQQIVDKGTERDLVSGEWSSLPGDRHEAMNGQKRPWGEPFVAPSGARLRFPGDTALGADGADVLCCRCYVHWGVDWIERYRREEARRGAASRKAGRVDCQDRRGPAARERGRPVVLTVLALTVALAAIAFVVSQVIGL